jgi:hypothetical protein
LSSCLSRRLGGWAVEGAYQMEAATRHFQVEYTCDSSSDGTSLGSLGGGLSRSADIAIIVGIVIGAVARIVSIITCLCHFQG